MTVRHTETPDTSTTKEWWDRRFKQERSPWGTEASHTARVATEALQAPSKILVVGFGYGREIPHLIRHGLDVSGVDPSVHGRALAQVRLQKEGLTAHLVTDYFERQTIFKEGQFDAIVSHRVLQLMITQDSIQAWAKMAEFVIRPNGMLIVGSRDSRDVSAGLLIPESDGFYSHQGRPGHKLSIWGPSEFQRYFSYGFCNMQFKQFTEIEAAGNPVSCHVTVMTAIRKK